MDMKLRKMYETSRVILSKKLWDSSNSKAELKQKIAAYMSKNYPDYTVIEVGKYYAICRIMR